MAADAVGEQLRDVHVLPQSQTVCDVNEHAVSAASAANAHQRTVRYRFQRGQTAWTGHQWSSHGRGNSDGTSSRECEHADRLLPRLEQSGRGHAQRQGLSLIDTARIFALLAVAIHDGLQTSFTSKFTYGLWRPVTAIRRAGEDLNGATDPDPAWTPLLTTPTYPSYAGNAACLSAASARALEIVFGKDPIPFTVTYPRTMGLPTETRTFASFADLAQQQADSRVLGGIHYRFDNEASQAYCVKVPEFTAENFMLPRNQ